MVFILRRRWFRVLDESTIRQGWSSEHLVPGHTVSLARSYSSMSVHRLTGLLCTCASLYYTDGLNFEQPKAGQPSNTTLSFAPSLPSTHPRHVMHPSLCLNPIIIRPYLSCGSTSSRAPTSLFSPSINLSLVPSPSSTLMLRTRATLYLGGIAATSTLSHPLPPQILKFFPSPKSPLHLRRPYLLQLRRYRRSRHRSPRNTTSTSPPTTRSGSSATQQRKTPHQKYLCKSSRFLWISRYRRRRTMREWCWRLSLMYPATLSEVSRLVMRGVLVCGIWMLMVGGR
jgi:hypothetical protein